MSDPAALEQRAEGIRRTAGFPELQGTAPASRRRAVPPGQDVFTFGGRARAGWRSRVTLESLAVHPQDQEMLT